MSTSPPKESRVVVFAYGSNMLSARMRERAPSARKHNIGQLVGHQLCWNKRSKDGSGKCSIAETGHPKDVVWGVIYEMSLEDKPRLDRAEGPGYAERVVKVITQTGSGTAMIYYATSIDPGVRPYDWYRNLVVAGAREHGLPEEYVGVLEKVVTVADSNAERAAKNRRLLAAPAI